MITFEFLFYFIFFVLLLLLLAVIAARTLYPTRAWVEGAKSEPTKIKEDLKQLFKIIQTCTFQDANTRKSKTKDSVSSLLSFGSGIDVQKERQGDLITRSFIQTINRATGDARTPTNLEFAKKKRVTIHQGTLMT